MEVRVERIWSDEYATLGILRINGKTQCFTLEDDKDEVKQYATSRIPQGRYELTLRAEGRFHQKYQKRFKTIHHGMLHIMNVPNYRWILIHCGNTPQDTAGCLLVGMAAAMNKRSLAHSRHAYQLIYPPICHALQTGEQVFITYFDNDDS